MGDESRSRKELLRELHELRELLAKEREHAGRGAHAAESAETYRSLLGQMRAFLVEVDEEGRVLYASPTITDVLGYSPEEYIGRSGFDVTHEDERAGLLARFRRVIETERPVGTIFRDRHKDGHEVWVAASGDLFRTPDGSLHLVSLVRDVSDLEQTRAALRESEERFQAMADNASDVIGELDDEGRVLFAGAKFKAHFGVDASEVLGRPFGTTSMSERFLPEDRAALLAAFQKGRSMQGDRFSLRYQHPDGRLRWFETTSTSYHTRTGELRYVLVTRDMTERVEAEERLRQSEERYRVVAEATRDLITEQDMDGRITYASPTCEAVLGYRPEQLIGRSATAWITHPEDLERVTATFQLCIESPQSVYRLEPYRFVRKDGSVRWGESSGISYQRSDGTLSVLGVTRDVTERRLAEEERRAFEQRLQQAQRLEGLGILAGGVAHDFNNLLTPILGEAGLALLELPAGSPLRPHLQSILRAAKRAAALTQQMLAYAGQKTIERVRVDLSALVREIGDLLASASGRRTRIHYELAPQLPAIEGDPAQIGQVAMNLITNAAESLGESGGTVHVRTGTILASQVPGVVGAELGEGEQVYLEVEDTGCGMDEATRLRIFEPFFTTKFTGRGLGLAASLGIMRSHHGAIEIESEPGRGSRFRVLFPIPEHRLPPPGNRREDEPSWRGSGSVMLVDDDEGVRAFAKVALGRCGLRVLTAADAREALETYAEHSAEIDVVLLDRTLPGTGSEPLLRAIRRIRPDVPIVWISGYAEESPGEAADDGPPARFLRKPFSHEELANEVRRALESPKPGPSSEAGP